MHTLHHHDLFIILLTAPVDMVNIPLFTGFYTSKRWLFGISSINSRDQEFVLGFHINFFHLSTFCFTNSRSWILPSWVTTDSFQRSWSHGWTSTLAMHFKMKGPQKLAAHRSRVIVTRSLKPSYSGNRWVGTVTLPPMCSWGKCQESDTFPHPKMTQEICGPCEMILTWGLSHQRALLPRESQMMKNAATPGCSKRPSASHEARHELWFWINSSPGSALWSNASIWFFWRNWLYLKQRTAWICVSRLSRL